MPLNTLVFKSNRTRPEPRLLRDPPVRVEDRKARRRPRPLAEILVDQGVIGPETLLKAIALQRHQDLPIGEILIAHGDISERQLLNGLCAQYDAKAINLATDPADATLAALLPAKTAITLSALPWRRAGQALIVVTNRPDQEAAIRAAFDPDQPLIVAIASRSQMHDALTRAYGPELARLAEARVPQQASCRNWNARRWMPVLASWGLAVAAFAWTNPVVLAVLAYGIALLVFFCNATLKLAALAAALRAPVPEPSNGIAAALAPLRQPIPLRRQPVVSILVPLLREQDIAGQLVKRLSRLDYPRELLDVILVLEAGDRTTQTALAQATLPSWMRAVTVPPGHPQTKPRALNYALNFARGSIIGIYDAEDRPDPDQIRKVVRRFSECPPEVVCLQGRLDYYNATHNWISRCFTIEYASWFRMMLPGVQRLGLFVPLGGTTLFLRRAALEAVGAWDAHNVTEDAELGLRLVRNGYRTEIVATTTYEEANSAILPWIRQRSRWLKGYAMTWVTHMRDPVALWRSLGARAFLGFQLQILGTVLGFLAAPLLWTFSLVPFGLPHPLDPVLTPFGFGMIGAGFVLALVLSLTMSFLACRAPHLRRHRLALPLMLLYFPLASAAAVLALVEMLLRPFHWAKTAHGKFSHRRGMVATPGTGTAP
ncbi:glycosyltransferase family 2 protein [Boseongicola sp. H5]|uniref:glycosyltransferase family 2 protein n=1 Tax=Boseongicola sp. H5 TaxID=2763261 RepID=UPI001D09B0A3|nr:glycosyltransferase family 2 protein [Boseongicola sp. H5]